MSTGANRPRLRWGLRWTLLVALLPLATLPWIGLRFVERMTELARDERLDGLAATARTLAAALHERRDLFLAGDDAAPLPPGVEAVPVDVLADATVDGRPDEWFQVPRRRLKTRTEGDASPRTLGVRLSIARAQERPGLFLLVDVDDERLVRPGSAEPAGGEAAGAAAAGSGQASGHGASGQAVPELPGDRVVIEIGDSPAGVAEVAPSALVLIERDGGWTAELALDAVPRLLRVRVVDVDYLGTRRTEATADSGLLAPSRGAEPRPGAQAARRAERWTDTLRALGRIGGRVSVYDAAGNLLVQRGDVSARFPPAEGWQAQLARWLLVAAVRMEPDPVPVRGQDAELSPMARALLGAGAQASQRIGEPGGLPVWLLSSAQPVWLDDRVVGALVLEENTATRVAIGQAALERLVLLAALAVAATVGALLIIASVTVGRIVRLRNAAERAIDARGRVVGSLRGAGRPPGTGSRGAVLRDELGELADGYERVLGRLAEHQDYLGKLRGRLVHELRTPIMVVRSSIENLALEGDETRRTEFLQRTQQGAARLERIVASMSEAANLESMLVDAELERVDLAGLLDGCARGYRGAFAPRGFELVLERRPAPADVVPEAIVQALDKLVANAVDFAEPGSAVVLALAAPAPGVWQLSVRNRGPALPAAMAGSLFDSMVSVRTGAAAEGGHLGLGLYLVRLIAQFHGGDGFARDIDGGVEVGFTLRTATG